MLDDIRWGFSRVLDFSLNELSVRYRILAAVVSCGLSALVTVLGLGQI